MASLDELDLALRPGQRTEDTIDAIPRVTKDACHAPLAESFNQKIAYGRRHVVLASHRCIEPPTGVPAGACKSLDSSVIGEVRLDVERMALVICNAAKGRSCTLQSRRFQKLQSSH
ncbi:hypothetical protein D3C73_911110 [compost metagenome]